MIVTCNYCFMFEINMLKYFLVSVVFYAYDAQALVSKLFSPIYLII